MKTLILLCGLPGSGKTTFCSQVLLPAYNGTLIRLSMDDLRKQLSGHDFYPPIEPIVRSWLDVTGQYFLEAGYNLVIDTTSLTYGIRAKWIQMAKKYDYQVKCYFLEVTPEECIFRNKNRKRFVPEDVIYRMAGETSTPSYGEGFDEIIFVQCERGQFKELSLKIQR